uniref:tripartite motif-containing protein 34-like isoform X3 n=1 Tax=Halichoerus grypus TaxID=9711 RepID=UPI0016590B93|nr:tripartite motif-containing protein 34-like isoform X3 [Halichoerus grypus]
MAFKLLTNIEEEVTCPICLDLLKEPLSLDCGHSFCKACIAAENKESVTSQGGKSSNCPVCQMAFCSGELRPNWHVANIVERLQEVKVSSEEEQKRNLCERHEEKLLLFCKKDGRVICWVCERSQEHRGHQTVPMEEAVQEYQEKLQTALQKLREEQQEAKMLEATLREERTSWKPRVRGWASAVKQGVLVVLDSCVKIEPHPRILFGLKVGLNNANLRPSFWNVMDKKIIGKVGFPKNCSLASLSFPSENFPKKIVLFLTPSLCR